MGLEIALPVIEYDPSELVVVERLSPPTFIPEWFVWSDKKALPLNVTFMLVFSSPQLVAEQEIINNSILILYFIGFYCLVISISNCEGDIKLGIKNSRLQGVYLTNAE